ncbi:MAG: NAD(P)H-quinone oxidoreductase [Burkholderiaceae bacterium]|jgi:putative PIG3 family NAD(P)H quinone oxidoreductase|nr:NAD(P)H-quinone oxidoreductase [Betaproteobacteria bacterium]
MKVIDHRPGGDASCIRLIEADQPTPKAGEVLIQVAYAGVNRPDILQRSGSYPPPPDASPFMGLEVSGTIVAVGDGVPKQRVGEQVCALTPGGGYAEFVVAPADHCMPIPAGLDLRTAACLPETFLTVWANLIERGQLRAGQSVLIHGGSSGIGTTAIGFAKWAGASRIFTTVGSEDKARICRELGADRPILYKSEDFAQVIKDETNGQGVNLVLDMVGGDYLPKHLKCLALEGRLVQIAFLSGAKVEMDWTLLMMKRLTFTGSTLRARSVEEKARIALTMQQAIWPELQRGRLLPIIHAEFPLAQAEEAHRLMESSQHVGKIVLKVG